MNNPNNTETLAFRFVDDDGILAFHPNHDNPLIIMYALSILYLSNSRGLGNTF